MKTTADQLIETVDKALPLLEKISNETAGLRPAEGKWSAKEIIGHLIDSATNNQQKFVRCMHAWSTVFPPYHQDEWVAAQHYNGRDWKSLLALWVNLNHHIAHIIEHIPDGVLSNEITIGTSGPFTLGFIAKDYPEHLKHHLKAILPNADFLENSFKMVY